ncbi:MAG TPA: accessory gene regulator B family protein [Bacillota bacterium]|nr:accessory gene regulator B family protein [Bacillota bacterium]
MPWRSLCRSYYIAKRRIKINSDNWYHTVSDKIGDILELTAEKRQVISYGLSVLVSNLIGLIVVLFIAYLIGALSSTLAMVAALLLLRPNAGGAHCSSSFNCNLFGFIFMPLFGYGAAWLAKCPAAVIYTYYLTAVILACWGILLKAPYFTQMKPRAEARRKKLKDMSLIIASLISAISLVALILHKNDLGIGFATGLLFQGIMLLPLGIRATQLLDGLFNNIVFKKRG